MMALVVVCQTTFYHKAGVIASHYSVPLRINHIIYYQELDKAVAGSRS